MTAITFDTLEYTEQLKAAGVPEEQAKCHAKALALVIKQVDARTDEQAARQAERNEKQIQSRLDGLATKHEMDAKIEIAKNETIKWMVWPSPGATGHDGGHPHNLGACSSWALIRQSRRQLPPPVQPNGPLLCHSFRRRHLDQNPVSLRRLGH